MRAYGLTCDNLLAADVVTADGSIVHASADDEPELYWALRGGGGNFGVVTSLELDLHPVGPEVLGGVVFYAGEEAEEIAAGWRDAVADAPDELSTLLNLTTAPPAPFIPEEWHFKKIAAVLACWSGEREEGEAAVKPLRSLGTVVNDLLGPIPYVQLQSLLDPLWERGFANYFTSTFIDRLPDDAVSTFADFHRESATCRSKPSCTSTTSVVRWAACPSTRPRSPSGHHRSWSTASRARPSRPTCRRTVTGRAPPGMRWRATARAVRT